MLRKAPGGVAARKNGVLSRGEVLEDLLQRPTVSILQHRYTWQCFESGASPCSGPTSGDSYLNSKHFRSAKLAQGRISVLSPCPYEDRVSQLLLQIQICHPCTETQSSLPVSLQTKSKTNNTVCKALGVLVLRFNISKIPRNCNLSASLRHRFHCLKSRLAHASTPGSVWNDGFLPAFDECMGMTRE